MISVLDGDVSSNFESEKNKDAALQRLNVAFLPIPSLEKYLHEHLIDNVDASFFREINDRFYRKISLDQVIADYQESGIDRKGKRLWQKMVGTVGDEGMSENEFLREICSSIYGRLDVESLTGRIRALF